MKYYEIQQKVTLYNGETDWVTAKCIDTDQEDIALEEFNGIKYHQTHPYNGSKLELRLRSIEEIESGNYAGFICVKEISYKEFA